MSYFPDLFKSPEEGFTAWLLHISSCGECVIYRLDENGKPTDCTTGDIDESFGGPLGEMLGKPCRVDVVENPDKPWSWGFSCDDDSWSSVLSSLKGKASDRRGRNRRMFSWWWYDGLDKYFTNYWASPCELTDYAKACDDKTRAKNNGK